MVLDVLGVTERHSSQRSVAAPRIDDIAETQEMLDFCREHGITADVAMIPIQAINEACGRILKSDVKYRIVSAGPP